LENVKKGTKVRKGIRAFGEYGIYSSVKSLYQQKKKG